MRVFQTEPHVWLLEHGPPGFDLLMRLVSALGTSWAYATVAIVLAFGVRLRPALLLTLALVTTGVAIDASKRGLALPRPEHVDDRVAPTAVVSRGGASDAWSLPPAQSIAATRAAGTTDWGMPSGHVASATVFMLAIGRRFSSRGTAEVAQGSRAQSWIAPGWLASRWLALAWIAAMALSRVALGKHFVADLVGGLAWGLAITAIFAWVERHARPEHHRMLAMGGIVAVALAFVVSAFDVAAPRQLGNFAGTTLVCVWSLRNDPALGDLRIRITRIAVAAALFGGGSAIVVALGHIPPVATALVSAAIVTATMLVPLYTIVPKPPLGTLPHA